MDLEKLIDAKDLLTFSQNFNIKRTYLGDTLFPDMKTQNLKAEFYRRSDQRMLPTMAQVHAFDTEAHIGQRPTIAKAVFSKLLIKEKINVTERAQQWLESGATGADALKRYIFDDAGRLAEAVKTRTEVAKMEALCKGKISINENAVKYEIDYHVPTDNQKKFDWTDKTHDILGDIQAIVDSARLAGQEVSQIITSTKVVALLRKNEGIQTAIYSALGKGTYVSNSMLANLIRDMFGLTITINDGYYQYEGAKGALTAKRYFDENKFVLCGTGALGVGVWGPTPEELQVGPWTAKSQQQFITITKWATPDPVAVWTKASGLFVPIIPNPSGLFINTIKLTA